LSLVLKGPTLNHSSIEVNMSDWKLRCVGRIARVDREELDKSGAGENTKLYLVMDVEESEAEAEGVEIGAQLSVGITVAALRRKTMRTPKAGERVELQAIANGVRPSHARLEAITFLEAAAPFEF